MTALDRSVRAAVEHDLAKLPADVRAGALAASALAMAREIDEPDNSATSKSMCQQRLQETLRELRALAPPKKESDGIDELGKRREDRLAALSDGPGKGKRQRS